jgi:hypothetical protein
VKGQVFEPLIKGPTWREIIIEALHTAPPELRDISDWDGDKKGRLADHILAALRKATVKATMRGLP